MSLVSFSGTEDLIIIRRYLAVLKANLIQTRFSQTPSHSPAFIEHLLENDIQFTDPKDLSHAAMRIASDPSINGRALGVFPRAYCKEGYVDLERDDNTPGSEMERWQQLMLASTSGL